MTRKNTGQVDYGTQRSRALEKHIAKTKRIGRDSVIDIFRSADELDLTYADIQDLPEKEVYQKYTFWLRLCARGIKACRCHTETAVDRVCR